MVKEFTTYIQTQKLFKPTNTLLVAVSGGADSITLCHLLTNAGFTFTVVHCNFNLRGKEADLDEKFVVDYCKKNNIKCFAKKFNTSAYAEDKGISIQMAARELRYNWFNEILTQYNFDYLLTAHHANDNIETFFINLLRGSGINGLKAILPKKNKLVRPLLFATRAEIESYIAKNNILYREDSSNKEDKYLRNHLRLQIIPALKKLNPSIEKTISTEIEILQQTNLILKKEVEKQLKKLLIAEGNGFKISIKKLEQTTAPKLILFELLKDFEFNTSQSTNIYDSLNTQSGKVFNSNTHILIKDRDFIFIEKSVKKATEEEFIIAVYITKIIHPINLHISYINGNINAIPKKDFAANKAYLDADKLTFPLTLNKWQTGDKFRPFGMKGFKKVSDFFIAEKTTLFNKQSQWILRCNQDIAWLVGKRVDDRFKVTAATKKICVISLLTHYG
jgi:tRNA(Ile)-lysidine synthase